ncbi:hypothetical protein HELRODRAFT_178828 [Helobdella robusta]|uniref:SCP domain-containing protein n=1 Tax=Helobdella robusta TaxID=6412 RepID=T1FDT0_HELRO|nr:hypothetical protein HELRODRAFT_178828 [Helobdella robusta]ESN95913.1 hypothetical protein HELRODRAFT_178828 [Helobdella robusta]
MLRSFRIISALVLIALVTIPNLGRAEGKYMKHNLREKRRDLKNSVTAEERLAFLVAHNGHRNSTTPPASDMRKMYYSSELEKSAQEWSNTCQFKHGNPSWITMKYINVGQNIWMGSEGYSIESMVGAWAAEKSSYTFSTNDCATDAECGHYTQVVWASSFKVGCGMTQCANYGDNIITVCNYLEAGNYVGEKPYSQGTACSGCPTTAPTCSSNLCAIKNNDCSKVEPSCTITDATNCLCDNSAYMLSNTTTVDNPFSSLDNGARWFLGFGQAVFEPYHRLIPSRGTAVLLTELANSLTNY